MEMRPIDNRAVDERQAHVWRSQALRLLNPASKTAKTETSVSNKSKETRQLACTRLYLDFIRGPVRLLCRDIEDVERRDRELKDIFCSAGEMATNLWTQRTNMKCFNIRHLQAFNIDNSKMVAHRLHHLDDDDHSLDGRSILAVIQPLVVAYGNDNEENYDQFKIWAKAVVLIAG